MVLRLGDRYSQCENGVPATFNVPKELVVRIEEYILADARGTSPIAAACQPEYCRATKKSSQGKHFDPRVFASMRAGVYIKLPTA